LFLPGFIAGLLSDTAVRQKKSGKNPAIKSSNCRIAGLALPDCRLFAAFYLKFK
jgi:hypothetical protein